MNFLDQARVQRAVLTYDFWLDFHGVPRRRRRDLRRELRANLLDAATRSGTGEAIAALGGIRRMASEVGVPDARPPRLTAGAYAAYIAVVVALLVQFLSALSWTQGAKVALPDDKVTGGLPLFPDASVFYDPGIAGGDSFGLTTGWSPFLLGLLVFVLVGRPWRLLSLRRDGTPLGSANAEPSASSGG